MDVAPAIRQINQRIRALADGKGIRFVNINSKLVDSTGRQLPAVSTDGLHLEEPGYEVWARAPSGRNSQPPIGRYPGRPIPMTGNSGMRLETFDWLGLRFIIRLRATAIARRPRRPIPGRGARDGPYWTSRSSTEK
jgi:hypothetical protein